MTLFIIIISLLFVLLSLFVLYLLYFLISYSGTNSIKNLDYIIEPFKSKKYEIINAKNIKYEDLKSIYKNNKDIDLEYILWDYNISSEYIVFKKEYVLYIDFITYCKIYMFLNFEYKKQKKERKLEAILRSKEKQEQNTEIFYKKYIDNYEE